MNRPTASSHAIDVGQTIGNYKVTAKLGEGGMGVVYLAEHPVIGRKVALKAIHPELSRNPEVVSRFKAEAQAVNKIGHEHIVDISDFGETADGESYFIMEYLQGESLADRLKRDGLLSEDRALLIAAQVADALGASHRHGIIHRDLKPENIFLIDRGRSREFVKVLDFGLAKLIQVEEKVSHKTRTGSVMGTPYYMSPEQCEGKISIDHRADIYSLGIILFEMLTGKVPFGGEGYGEIIVKHVTHQPPSARGLVPDLSQATEMILYRSLAKDREERFQSMDELREALLDPEMYAANAPLIGLGVDDLSGVARAAAPMSRSQMSLPDMFRPLRATPPAPGEPARPTDPTMMSATPRPRAAAGSGALAITPPPPGAVPSTSTQGMGEVVEQPALPARSSRNVVLAMLSGVAFAGLTIVLISGARRQPRSPAVAAAAAPVTPAPAPQIVPLQASPTAVRVNFNSDPGGATVKRADSGKVLGTTPLSIEVPYSNDTAAFVFAKDGYEPKTMYIVPNLPAPVFAMLHPLPPPPPPTPHRPTGAGARHPGAAAHPATPAPVDEDGVLEPTFR